MNLILIHCQRNTINYCDFRSHEIKYFNLTVMIDWWCKNLHPKCVYELNTYCNYSDIHRKNWKKINYVEWVKNTEKQT